MSSKVKVAVRVRPLNKREIDIGTDVVIDMKEDQTFLKTPKNEKKSKRSFAFDHCFWSMDKNDPKFSSQEYVFKCLGTDVLENAFNGYNACIFAYGQTGSGKSYTMMGTSSDKGLIPKICDSLFEQIDQNNDEDISYKVEVSYMEIYNEKVRDLLCPKSDKHSLKVREHNILGPYVDGLSKLLVKKFQDIENLMSEGNKSRTVAATSMNAESSRSHAVFTVVMTQSHYDEMTKATGEKVSKISLVDLAGSERASKTNASGDRLKEGSNINKSLTTLGLVISALADQASGKAKQKKASFVPYRDSVLTWLLKDNLGGNSKTVMVATLSPSGDNYEETLSTLRYADRAKRIENHAVVNEDPNAKLIRELREEVETLKQQLLARGMRSEKQGLQEQLDESEKLMQEASLTWEQKEKQTEQIHQERHKILEKMGICVQDSGIAVEKGRYYLVNLNADPSLNEMLVYYLKDHTKVGRPDANTIQDIQLNGLGILSEHCIIDIEESEETAYLKPFEGARTCVNGQVVTDRTMLRHGDRILWGNNHFFRINCPHPLPPAGSEPEEKIDYDFAQNELLLNEFDSLGEPLQVIIQQLEEHHEKEKQGALDQQKEMYEQKLEELRREKTPDSLMTGRASSGYVSEDRLINTPQSFYDSQLLYEESLRRLREEVIRANVLVREANQLSMEMKKDTEFAVTLQIPTASLSQGMSRGPLTSEVAVVVKSKSRGTQVWSVDKIGNKIYDMRDAYQSIVESDPLQGGSTDTDDIDDGLFFEIECHTLIGVATVWLECLYQNVPLDYSAPVISQQGEVCGRLSVEIKRLQDENATLSIDGDSFSDDEDNEGLSLGSSVKVQITIKEVHGLPLSLCNYVFCQYTFFDQGLTVVPPLNAATSPVSSSKSNSMMFDHTKMFVIDIEEEFLDYVTDGSLAIEVYGNRSRGFDQKPSPIVTPTENEGEKSMVDRSQLQQSFERTRLLLNDYMVPKSFAAIQKRWRELTRRLELWVEIHELNEQGFYSPVELLQREGQEAGGVFMLRQGYSRRIVVQCVVPKSGANGLLPVVIESITNIALGSVTVRGKTQKGLDSYQERDLQTLRDRFSNSVMKRREFLDHQIQEMINKSNKTQDDKEHEGMLIDQWVSLTEERNAILCPSSGSGVPGATMDWNPLPGMEKHVPVIFLDLDDNALSGCADIDAEPAGHHSFLSFEQSDSIIGLPILKYDQKRVTATSSWDSSIHDSVYLNRVTPNTERVYVILKVTLRLSSPALVNVILRKRVCVRIYKRPSLKDSLRKKFWRQTNVPTRCGNTFELISHIPRQSGEQTEERESLAQKAAIQVVSGDGEELMDSDAIEKYNKGISHVENILNLHKLRQEVIVKEKLAAVGRSSKSLTARNMRKFASTPNLFNAPSMSNLWRSNNFPSNSDLNNSELGPPPTNGEINGKRPIDMVRASRASTGGEFLRNKRNLTPQKNEARHSFYGFENRPSESSPRLTPREVTIDIGEDRPQPSPRDMIPRNSSMSAMINLHPLIEDDGPGSPNSPKDKVMFGNTKDTDTESKLIDLSNNKKQEDGEQVTTTPRSLSEFPTDVVEQANLERSRLIRRESLRKVKDLPLPEQGVTQETVATVESPRDPGSPPPALKVGDVVRVSETMEGQVRFYGRTQFADGVWVGIALSIPDGKNDGSVNGVSYFNCEPLHGLFIRAEKLAKS
ncbi:kinesin-like protein KIF13A isoform X3 [Hydractinia symbiolongicarpus]|uniref:kinesin-like protein KIF13A isoform X3 n=1 Tax=Hydractinia symbiolongicarpus TaxID=13093 RepID=UPI00254B7EFB|nr:kinesin-like protein KIF13A isoform X3 [Hydractinia symbiolongicarpus]